MNHRITELFVLLILSAVFLLWPVNSSADVETIRNTKMIGDYDKMVNNRVSAVQF